MRRRPAAERAGEPAETRQGLESLIGKMTEHLIALERKLDTLISRTSERPLEVRFSNPYQRAAAEQPPRASGQPDRPPEQRRHNNPPRERIMHKAVCADCKSACEVPFQPVPGRPVYCKDCYAGRRNGGHARAAHEQKAGNIAQAQQKRHAEPAPAAAPAAPVRRQSRKPAAKKKDASRKRK